MEVVYIYRSIKMGYSIDNVFRPIEQEMKKHGNVSNITFENSNYNMASMVGNIIKVRKYMRKNPGAIIHITGTENYLIPFLKKYKTVVTVHDLGFYRRMKRGIRRTLKYLLFVKSIEGADKVLFISESSLIEAKELLNLRSNQASVTENPVNAAFKPPKNFKFNKKCPTLLHIGTKTNKNLERTAEAVKGIECKLKIIGVLTDVQRSYLDSLDIKYEQVQNLTNEEMLLEYQNCDIVIFASLYEGFGMPIIEGQATGKVVITSDIEPMKGIARGSCILVNPESVESIHDGILKAIDQHEQYEKMGAENVKRFSVSSKAEELLAIYKKL